MSAKKVTFDFETRSACDLKKAGAYKYSLDPTTQPTCLAYKERGGHIQLLDFYEINRPWKELPFLFREMWANWIWQGYLFSAHNAFFERCIYTNILVRRYGWPMIPFRQYRCTAAKAAACALPRNLEGAGEAMQLSTQKDKRGYVAMMATCKPTKQWNSWKKKFDADKARKSEEPPQFLSVEAAPQIWKTLYTYCKIDVQAEELLDESLPDLIPIEQEVWFLNQEVNWRGLKIDIPAVQKIVQIMAFEKATKLKELDSLTMGLVTKPGARQSILEFLALEGIHLPDIRANTVDDVLKSGKLSEDMKRLLEIRKALSKTSTKKYQAFLDRAGADGRVRDILLYHGASTGRDTGTGIQPQNFPRPVIRISKDRPYAALETIMRASYQMLKILYGESLPLVFSSILRNMIIPSEGCELYVADFSKIEVAVLWWLADNWPGLKVLNSGGDPYKYQAAANLEVRYEDISDEGDERQLGKAQVLGCGFRMSWKRFKDAAWDQYRLKLTNKQSVAAVKSYREANAPVVELWDTYESAAIAAIETGKTFKAGKCIFSLKAGFLWIELPSGRKLAYRSPRIVWGTPTYDVLEVNEKTGEETIVTKTGRPRKTIEFLGLDKSKKKLAWERTHGGVLTENIVQGLARELLKHGELRLAKRGYTPLLPVHDESICEKGIGKGSLEEFEGILCERPKWADRHLPLVAKGWKGPRYRK